jgi:hypothetical protein
MPVAWSSKYSSDDFPLNYEHWTVEDKINLFEDQVIGWQLGIADEIINKNAGKNPHAGFAVLSIILSYFERIGKYLDGYAGTSQPKAYFIKGLNSVFPLLEEHSEIIDLLYYQVRCGMYHEAIIGGQIILSADYSEPIQVIDELSPVVAINPHTLTTALIEHFTKYINDLRKSSTDDVILINFLKRFDSKKNSKLKKLEQTLLIDSMFS